MSAIAEKPRTERCAQHWREHLIWGQRVWRPCSGRRNCPRPASILRNALLAACALILTLTPAPASATFHLNKIMEIFPGTGSQPAAQYVMLQMYAPGENFVQGHFLDVFDASGERLGRFTFGSNVANGADRAAILIATPEAESLFGIEADLEMTASGETVPTPPGPQPGPYGVSAATSAAAGVLLPPAGGAVCWDVVDCVAWGSFAAPNALPMIEGPVIAPTGLTLGMAMHRDFTDNAGDTTDFALAPPAPRNNAGQVGEIGETPTPGPEPSATVTPPGPQPTATPSEAVNTPVQDPPYTTDPDMGSGGGGGGCAVDPLTHRTWSGVVLLLLLPALLVCRRSKER